VLIIQERPLRSYVGTYLKEDIQAESLTRNLPAFASFKSYISILEDTLIGFSLPGFTKTKKRKAITRAKHYMFDIGVVNQHSYRN